MNYLAHPERYESMSYKRCGKSGLLLPPVSLGLWHNFGGVDTYETGREIILGAFDRGITHFDLANNYGPPAGSAEENFGRMLKNDLRTYRDELVISTKAGYNMWTGPYGEWGSKKYLVASLDQSLKRMGLEYVDIFYSHRPDPETPFEETMETLDLVRRQGKTLYVGLSNYDERQTRQAVEILESLGTHCLIHQPKYSMFNRWVEDGLLDLLEGKGIGCIPFSPLAQGLLTDKYVGGIPENSRAAKSHGFLKKSEITDNLLDKVRSLNSIAVERNQSLAQMALAWLLRDDRVTSVLIGASSLQQLTENLKCLENTGFSKEELERIEKILRS